MSWLTVSALVLGIGIINFLSLFGAVGLMKYLDTRQKRKFVEKFMDELEDKITTEVKFQKIAEDFEKHENEEGNN